MDKQDKIGAISINGIEYIKKTDAPTKELNAEGLPYVVIRTYSAGVHAGSLAKREGKEVTLYNTRRIWYWSGAASLSQLALEGVKNPKDCKFSVVLPEIILMEAIELLPCTKEAFKSISEVAVWKN